MIKKIVLSTIATTTLLSVGANAMSVEDRIAKLEKIIIEQQKKIDALSASKKLNINNFKDDIEDLDERLETIETRSYTDKISFGLGFKQRMDNFDRKLADGTTKRDNNIMSTKLMLNMKSKITDNMKFSGRLSMYKYWADSDRHSYEKFDSMQGRTPGDSTIFAERAYIDWTVTEKGAQVPVTLTIGRQPSSDGPSYEFIENSTRKSTYSALAFDGAADGIVATVGLSKAVGMEDTALRIAYGKGYQDDSSTDGEANAYDGNSDVVEDSNIYGLFYDTVIPGYDNSLIQLGYVAAKDVVGDARGADSANGSGAQVNIGDISLVGAMFQIPKVTDRLDVFAHYGVSKAKPNGVTFDASGTGHSSTAGLLTSTTGDTATKTGHAYWVGARYTLNKDYKVGLEYNKGDKYWISMTQGSHDPYNKLATRGDAIELYITKVINKYSNIRLGTIAIDYDYSGSGWHTEAPVEIKSTMTSPSNYIDKITNTYLQFNVLF